MQRGDRGLVLISLLLLFGLGLSILLLPQRSFSQEENRALTTWVTPSVSQLWDGSAIQQLRGFYADQFPLRSSLATLKAETARLLGRQENNGILFGKDGYLIPRAEHTSLSVARENLAAYASFSNGTSLPCSLLIAPRAVDVLTKKLSAHYVPDEGILRLIADSGVAHTLPLDALRAAAEEGEGVWYRTDHHWTTRGAYLAYLSLAEALDITPYPPSYFRLETVSEGFLGTSHSKAGMPDTPPDRITLYRYAADPDFLVFDHETGETSRGFYQWEALAQKDQYEIFLGGNYSRLSVSLPGESRPRLLLIKDSYANSLVPFLALHFDLELVDPRYYRGSLAHLLEEETFDRVLVVQGLDTLATDEGLLFLTR